MGLIVRRGRARKIKPADVPKVVAAYQEGTPAKELAAQYGCHAATIIRLVHRAEQIKPAPVELGTQETPRTPGRLSVRPPSESPPRQERKAMKDYRLAIQKILGIYGANPPVLVSALNTLVNTAVEDRQRRDVEEMGKLAKHIFDDDALDPQPLCKGQSTGVACITCYEAEMARIAGDAERAEAPAAPTDPDVERVVREVLGGGQ